MIRKMILVNPNATNATYKPCLDGKDVHSVQEITDMIVKASACGNTSSITELARQLVRLDERNKKAQRNEDFIQKICNYIVRNTSSGDVLCENELAGSVRHDTDIRTERNDTCLEVLVRASLMRLAETGHAKRGHAKVYAEGDSQYNANVRTIYTIL